MIPERSGENSLDALFSLLEEWRGLTASETDCIQSNDWARLQRIQNDKVRLQTRIEEMEASVLGDDLLPEERKAAERLRLKEVASQLLGLEEQNRNSLANLLDQVETQLKSADQTVRKLRNVQTAYGRPNQSFWQAYS